jgi:hypothetical protein
MTTGDTPAPPIPPFGIRRPGLLRTAIVLLVAIVVTDLVLYPQLAHSPAASAMPATSTTAVVLKAETGPGGHATIGVAETAGSPDLTFGLLGKWAFHPSGSVPCPAPIMAHDHKTGTLVGFMYPLAQGDAIKVFCLLRNTQTCCFGPRPQFNQYLLVECAEPVPFERRRPVQVSGRFVVDPQPTQGYIYRLEDAHVAAVSGFDEPVDARIYAEANHLPLWDWSVLGQMAAGGDHPAIPPALTALEGATVVVDGYIHQRDPGPPAQITVGFHPPPGRPDGHVPTLFDAMSVMPETGVPLPSDWQDRGVWQGTVHITNDAKGWDENGVVHIDHATICAHLPPGMASARINQIAILIVLFQVMLVGGLLVSSLGRRAPSSPAA